MEQKGVCFVVRLAAGLARKRRQAGTDSSAPTLPPRNPFLPYDPNLFVADISDTHVCLLNKYSVIDQHLLIVTRAFEEQDSLLDLADFAAMWACLAEIDGLAFYNGGKVAGASQRHKHLQLVPLPVAFADSLAGTLSRPRVPIEVLFPHAPRCAEQAVSIVEPLAFAHAFTWLDPTWMSSPRVAAEHTLTCYRAMLQATGVGAPETTTPLPYNLLVTREWMLLVARVCESFDTISINSLGFAGSLFARSPKELQTIKKHGPMTILEHVAAPFKSDP